MHWSVRPTDFFPVLDRAGEQAPDLLARQIADRAASVHNDGYTVGADDLIIELKVPGLGLLLLLLDHRARSCGDVAYACDQAPIAGTASLGLQLDGEVRMVRLPGLPPSF